MRYLLLFCILPSLAIADDFPEPDWAARYNELYTHYYQQHRPPKLTQPITIYLNMRSPLKAESIAGTFVSIQDKEVTLQTTAKPPETLKVPHGHMSVDSRKAFFPKDYAHYTAYQQVQKEKAEWPAIRARLQAAANHEAREKERKAMKEREEALRNQQEEAQAKELERQREWAKIRDDTKTGTILQVLDDQNLVLLNYKPDPKSYKTFTIAIMMNDTTDYVIGDTLKVHLKENGTYPYTARGDVPMKVRRYEAIKVLQHIKP